MRFCLSINLVQGFSIFHVFMLVLCSERFVFRFVICLFLLNYLKAIHCFHIEVFVDIPVVMRDLSLPNILKN